VVEGVGVQVPVLFNAIRSVSGTGCRPRLGVTRPGADVTRHLAICLEADAR